MKEQKTIKKIAIIFALLFGITPAVNAMHIMEGYLPVKYCVSWGIISLPFLIAGFFSIKKTLREDRKSLVILAMSGAFIFVISSLKIPSVTGSCSHMTGTGLGAILFGPFAVGILGIIVLIFQAILLAYIIYILCKKLKVNKKLGIFLAASLGDLFTYSITSLQLAIAYPSPDGGIGASAIKFLGVFAPTQIPLAIVEGILTVIVIIGLETYAKSELTSIGFMKEGK